MAPDEPAEGRAPLPPDEGGELRQRLVDGLLRRGTCRRPSVEAAMRAVPRHRFVPEVGLTEAYQDRAIVVKTEAGATVSSISQPTIVAIMLDMLEAEPGDVVLEVGAGTGYNAALLSHVVGPAGRVVAIEVDADLAERARRALQAQGVANVDVETADGREGWAPAAPFDGIIVTAAADAVADAWRDQLAEGGRLVVPLGPSERAVALVKRDGDLVEVATTPAWFVPLRDR